MSSGINTTDLTAHNSRSGGISTAVVFKICQTGASVKPRVQYPPIDDSLDDLCLDLDWENFATAEFGGMSSFIQPAIAILWVPFLIALLAVFICQLYGGAEYWIKELSGYLVDIGAAIRSFIVLPEDVFPEDERPHGSRKKRTIRMLDLDTWVH